MTNYNMKSRQKTDAKDTFEELKRLVDQACTESSWGMALAGVERLGISGGPTEDPHTLEYKFELIDNAGGKVSFRYVSIDQSRAFSVRPDLNKFEVILTRATGDAAIHRNAYED
ncbi:hypothetical protein [Paraburkholderia terrae]|uniref:hypothetical protein n=1 Tax=Paraburkholderia terrae TaxID=311230 RepID=UPI0020BD4B0C|nr:hypothetical protein [Paraburkholderia terrae]